VTIVNTADIGDHEPLEIIDRSSHMEKSPVIDLTTADFSPYPQKPTLNPNKEPTSKYQTSSASSDVNTDSPIFEIVLLIDNRELHQQNLQKELELRGIICERRQLDLGDIIWVARRIVNDRQTISTEDDEFLLHFIVERKRIEDLVASIEDGRYKEQKFRLKRCGLKFPVYLVEGTLDYSEAHFEMCENAMISTQIEYGFLVKRTASEQETILYLENMTKRFMDLNRKRCYENHSELTFGQFASAVSKSGNLTLSDLFAKQLFQLPSSNPEKVSEVIRLYPTPYLLMSAYKQILSEREGQEMLKDIEYTGGAVDSDGKASVRRKKIGPAFSRALFEFYCNRCSWKMNDC